MKRLFATAFVVMATATSLWSATGKPKLTPEQIEERKYRHFGGYVFQQRKTNVISIANEQKAIPDDVLQSVAAEMQNMLGIPVQVNAVKDVGVTLRVRDADSACPLSVMPDNAAAIVDVKALSADSPASGVLQDRGCKELWRGLIYVLGGGNTYVRQCVMKQISSLKELDALPSKTACPDAFMRIAESAKARGIQPVRRVTYRQACKEGWAPQPTNDVQKAIWQEMRQLPTKPILIKFDPKKGK